MALLSGRPEPREELPAFQWNITAKDPAVLQLDGLGCGLQLGGQRSRRGRALGPPAGQGVPVEGGDGRVVLGGVLLVGRGQRLQRGLAVAVGRWLCKRRRKLVTGVCAQPHLRTRPRFPGVRCA